MADIITEKKTILDNVQWSSNEPKIYLTLSYDVRKDGERILNRGGDSYTFFNLTLTVSMPGKYAYYGYSIYATIISGQQRSASIMLKGNQPQYWKEYSYNFGDYVVSAKSDSVYVPIGVLMNTSAPGYYVEKYVVYDVPNMVEGQRQGEAIKDKRVVYQLTDKGRQYVQANTSQSNWGKTPTWEDLKTVVTKQVQPLVTGKVNGLPLDVRLQWGSNMLTDENFKMVKKVYADVITGYKTETYEYQDGWTGRDASRTVSIEKRDGMFFGVNNWFIGLGYELPYIVDFSLKLIGGYSILVSCQYEEKWVGSLDDSWQWRISLYRGESPSPTQTVNSKSITELCQFTDLRPDETYRVCVDFGDSTTHTETLCKVVPPRDGFYVAYGGKWNYCCPNIGTDTGQQLNTFKQISEFGVFLKNKNAWVKRRTIQDDGSLDQGGGTLESGTVG